MNSRLHIFTIHGSRVALGCSPPFWKCQMLPHLSDVTYDTEASMRVSHMRHNL